MALWPNTRSDILGFAPMSTSGAMAFQETAQRVWRNVAYFAGEQVEETSSVPEGAFPGAAIIPPLVSGGMSAANNATDISATAAGNVLAGGPVEGAASATFSQTGGLALQVTLAGDGTITVSQSGSVALTIALAGNGTASITGTGGLSMIVPFDGAAAFALTGAANLKGNLALSGDITPFTELSPQNLADAVWSALSAGYVTTGTMGAKLNSAASGGVDYLAMAEAVRTELAAELARLDAAISSRQASGAVVDADVRYVNGVEIGGTGTPGDTWGPA